MDERHALEAIARRVSACMAPRGLVLLTHHYFFGFHAASRRTRAIHDAFGGAAAFHHYAEHRRCFYLATLLQPIGYQFSSAQCLAEFQSLKKTGDLWQSARLAARVEARPSP